MDLTEILIGAQSADENLRENSFGKLQNAKENDLPLLMLLLAQELENEKKPIVSRQLAGIFLKNTFVSRDSKKKETLAKLWLQIEEEKRMEIKQLLVLAFKSTDRVARNTSAQVIGVLGSLEYKNNIWDTVFEDLILFTKENSSSQNSVKEAILCCLGYLCEELSDLEEIPNIKSVLQLIANSMANQGNSVEIQRAATKAFYNSLHFFRDAFKNKQDSDILLKSVINSANSEDLKVSKCAFECLVKIADLYYNSLKDHILVIFDLTLIGMKSKHEEIILQSIEFWSSLCEEEEDILFWKDMVQDDEENEEENQNQNRNKNRNSNNDNDNNNTDSKSDSEDSDDSEDDSDSEEDKRIFQNYIKGAVEFLIPPLCELLTCQDEFEEKWNEGWGVLKSATVCINLVAWLVESDIIEHVSEFIQTNLVAKECNYKEASILCLISILEIPKCKELTNLITYSLPFIIEYMDDENPKIRDSSSYAIGKLIEFHYDIICLDNDLFNEIIKNLIALLEDLPYISVNAAWSFTKLAENKNYSEFSTSELSKYFIEIVDALFKAANREDGLTFNLRFQAYAAISSSFLCAAEDTLGAMYEALEPMVKRLEETCEMEILSVSDEISQAQIQGSLCGVLQFLTIRLGERIMEYGERVMKCYIQIFKNNDTSVHNEAMMAIGSLINALDEKFIIFLPDIHPYLIEGVNSYSQPKLCSLSITFIGDLFASLEKKITKEYHSEYMETLLEALHSEKCKQEMKPSIISVLGDIAISIKEEYVPYLNKVGEMLEEASNINISYKNEEDFEYTFNLHKAVLLSYSEIITGLSEGGVQNEFLPFIDNILVFLQKISTINRNYLSNEILKAAVGLIGDIINTFGKQVKSYFKQQYIFGLIKICTRSTDDEVVEIGKWSSKLLL
ncbi:importin subunit beta-1 [Anaeramoeba flamelloides]|uniref:Importin subunit beta-1 n=1 Tax=Anaeramoeba flamelloides TaxID=1746091 RepID=A0AAV8A3D4_9EUKA|nr:importin subunit beta-1 [Anaeramoeba flamelloides]